MKKMFLTVFSSLLLLSSTGLVIAQDETKLMREERLQKKEERLEQRRSLLDKLKLDRCTRLSERIDNRVEGYEKNKDKHVIRYTNLQKRLDILIEKLRDLGLDVSKLEQDKEVLQTLVDDFLAKYSLFANEMKGVKKIACDEEGKVQVFKKDVQASREYLKDARDAAKAIHEFVKNTLKQDLLALKEQVAKLNSEENKDEE